MRIHCCVFLLQLDYMSFVVVVFCFVFLFVCLFFCKKYAQGIYM